MFEFDGDINLFRVFLLGQKLVNYCYTETTYIAFLLFYLYEKRLIISHFYQDIKSTPNYRRYFLQIDYVQ